ncbi:MAG: hypothetical protein PHO52_13400 [Sulfuricurvum sp.]|uniref:hypothetical protein n=1 Tax=Sulfuricurvum sp. TaxID=2025608 RepID=UPI00260A6A20|nr:hypothetical protein [Sulfuricurvum sp.]MDD2785199.1 hypothetical protein [Sulfuricurvum sp.]
MQVERNVLNVESIKQEGKSAFAEAMDDLNASIASNLPLNIKEVHANKIRNAYYSVFLKDIRTQKFFAAGIFFVVFWMLYFSFTSQGQGLYLALYGAIYNVCAAIYFYNEFSIEQFFKQYSNIANSHNSGLLAKTFLEKVFNGEVNKVKDAKPISKKATTINVVFFFVIFMLALTVKSVGVIFFFSFIVHLITMAACAKSQF